MSDALSSLTAAVDSRDPEAVALALAQVEPVHVTRVFFLSFQVQQTHPELALRLIRWVIDAPRPTDEQEDNWLRAHNNGCFIAAAHGDDDTRRYMADRAMAIGADNVPIFHNAACVYCALDMPERALEAVKCAVDHEYEHLAAMATDPDLDLILDTDEFRALLGLEKTGDDEMPATIATLVDQLGALRAADRWRNHMMRAPLAAVDIDTFESEWGIRLPEDYAAFLEHVGDGGAGRAMVFRLSDTYAPDTHGSLGEDFDPDQSGGTGLHDGVITLSHEGEGRWAHLVISGPARGQVWTEAADGSLSKAADSFVDWYGAWLDERHAAIKDNPTTDNVAPYAAIEAPAWAAPWTAEQIARFVRLVQIRLLAWKQVPDFSHTHCGNVYVGGSKFNLVTLHERCAAAADSDWPAIIGEHFDNLLTPSPEDPAEIRAYLRPRLYRPEQLTGAAIAREFAGDLVEALALDLPTRVESASERTVASLELDKNELFALARRNLAAEPQLELDKWEDLHPSIRVWSSDSFFSATHVLRLADYIDDEAAAHVVAMPCRHALVVAPVAADFHEVIRDLVLLAHQLFDDGPGSLTPHPYLHHDGSFTRIFSGINPDSGPWCAPPQQLLEFLDR